MRIVAVTFLLLAIRRKSSTAYMQRELRKIMFDINARSCGSAIETKEARRSWVSRSTPLATSTFDSDAIGHSQNSDRPGPRKFHTLTVCMVPHPTATAAWEKITLARTQLKDPGLFRWPPHVNLLYPFVDIKPTGDLEQSNRIVSDEIVDRIRAATKQCEPFNVTLDALGCFGGAKRGVLWFYPTSRRDTPTADDTQPLIDLHSSLEEQFPECKDQQKHGPFAPHMTISHFPTLDDSNQALEKIEEWWPKDLTFRVGEIYLLERQGDDDQFLRVASIRLGHSPEMGESIIVHNPPEAFPAMPTEEEAWVRHERMTMKERRRIKGSTSNGKRTTRVSPNGEVIRGQNRRSDTPEEIDAKRLARAAKREALEQAAPITVPKRNED